MLKFKRLPFTREHRLVAKKLNVSKHAPVSQMSMLDPSYEYPYFIVFDLKVFFGIVTKGTLIMMNIISSVTSFVSNYLVWAFILKLSWNSDRDFKYLTIIETFYYMKNKSIPMT